MRQPLALRVGTLTVLAIVCAVSALAGEADPSAKDVQAVLDKAIAFLKAHQGKDGGFAPKVAGPGVSALVVAALARNGVGPTEPVQAATLNYLEKQIQQDGGIYSKLLANYTTSVALMAFKECNQGGKYDGV